MVNKNSQCLKCQNITKGNNFCDDKCMEKWVKIIGVRGGLDINNSKINIQKLKMKTLLKQHIDAINEKKHSKISLAIPFWKENHLV